MDWKPVAKDLFFVEKKNATEISELLGKSRRSVSAYLNTLDGYIPQKGRTKTNTPEKRREYKRDWIKERRHDLEINTLTMKNEHDIAAMILSRERHCNDPYCG